jgi:hypothetical protein
MRLAGTCSTHGKKRNQYNILVGKPERNKTVGRLRLTGRIILNWILKNRLEGVNWIDLAQYRCQLGNGPFDFTKGGELLDQLLKKHFASWGQLLLPMRRLTNNTRLFVQRLYLYVMRLNRRGTLK